MWLIRTYHKELPEINHHVQHGKDKIGSIPLMISDLDLTLNRPNILYVIDIQVMKKDKKIEIDTGAGLTVTARDAYKH